MSLALCPQVVSQAPQHLRSSRSKPLVRVELPAVVVAVVVVVVVVAAAAAAVVVIVVAVVIVVILTPL